MGGEYLILVKHSQTYNLTKSLSLARRRHRRGPVVMMLVMGLIWLIGQAGQLYHEARVAHAMCAEHGELVELHGETAGEHDHEAGWQVDRAALVEHDHGCSTQVASFGAALQAKAVVLPLPLVVPLRLYFLAPAGARAPPLGYAPKTSPPALA